MKVASMYSSIGENIIMNYVKFVANSINGEVNYDLHGPN